MKDAGEGFDKYTSDPYLGQLKHVGTDIGSR
jgi:hypothetical protein